jgi:hypothetical protein
MKISAINNSPNFGTKVVLEDKSNKDITFDQMSNDTQSEFLKAIKKLAPDTTPEDKKPIQSVFDKYRV